MNKSRIVVALAILCPLQVFAAQQPLQTRANTTSPSVDTNFSRQQLMNTEIYTTKADKDKVVRYWADFPDGGDAISAGTPVWYDGKLYNTIQAFVKTSGATPDTFTEYFEVASGSGGVTNYAELDGKPTLGTAAALDAGTEPGSVVQIDSSGKLPPLDGSQITGLSGTLPNCPSAGQTWEWDAATNSAKCVEWSTISADGTTIGITGGVLSVKSGVFESADADIVKVYEIDTREKFAALLGWSPEGGSAAPTVQAADPTSSSPAGWYAATGSGHVFLQTPSHLFDINAGTATANYRTLTLIPPEHGTISVTDSDLTPNTLTCGTGGTTCSGTSLNGVTGSPLVATADSGYAFTAWGGEATGGTYNTGAVVMDGDKTVSAVFSPTESSTTLVSQLLSDQTVDLSLYSVAQSFTLSNATTETTLTVGVEMPTVGSTCEMRLGTAWDLATSANRIGATAFTPQIGMQYVSVDIGHTIPSGVYMVGLLCDTGTISRNSTDVYAGGLYHYGASKTFNVAVESAARDLKLVVREP